MLYKIVHKTCLVLVACDHNLSVSACHGEGSNCLRLSGLGSFIQKNVGKIPVWNDIGKLKGCQASSNN